MLLNSTVEFPSSDVGGITDRLEILVSLAKDSRYEATRESFVLNLAVPPATTDVALGQRNSATVDVLDKDG